MQPVIRSSLRSLSKTCKACNAPPSQYSRMFSAAASNVSPSTPMTPEQSDLYRQISEPSVSASRAMFLFGNATRKHPTLYLHPTLISQFMKQSHANGTLLTGLSFFDTLERKIPLEFDSYFQALELASENGDILRVRGYLSRFEETLPNASAEQQAQAYLATIKAYAKRGYSKEVLALIALMKEKQLEISSEVTAELFRAYFVERDFGSALRVMTETSLKIPKELARIAFSGALEERDMEAAKFLFKYLQEQFSLTENSQAFRELAVQKGEADLLHTMYKNSTNQQEKVANMTAYVQALAMAFGDTTLLWKAFHELLELSRAGTRTVAVFYVTRSISLSSQRLDEAFTSLNALKESNAIKVRPEALEAVIRASGLRHDLPRALLTYEQFEAWGFKPDTSAFNSLLFVASRLCRQDVCDRVVELMLKTNTAPDAESFHFLIDTALKGKNWTEGMRQFMNMKQAGLKPERYTLENALCKLARAGMQNEVTKLWNDFSMSWEDLQKFTQEYLRSVQIQIPGVENMRRGGGQGQGAQGGNRQGYNRQQGNRQNSRDGNKSQSNNSNRGQNSMRSRNSNVTNNPE